MTSQAQRFSDYAEGGVNMRPVAAGCSICA